MDGQLAAPFHFAAEFLILAVCAGAAADALRGIRNGAGPLAWIRAAGFASLVAAQIAHGALVVEGDGEISIIVLRAVGFGLLALSLKPIPAGGLPAIFFAGNDARWAALPAFFAIVASARLLVDGRKARDTASLALAGAFALFAAGEAALVAADPAGGGAAFVVSHAARAAGAVLLARWLWTSFARSVRLRFVAVFVAALVLLATVVAGALTQVIGNNLEHEELQRLQVISGSQKRALQQRVQFAIQQTNTLADLLSSEGVDFAGFLKSPAAARAFFTGPGSALLLPPDVDFLVFLDGKGKVTASARETLGSSQAPEPTVPPLTPVELIALRGCLVIRQALAPSPVEAGDIMSIELRKIAVVGAAAVRQRGKTVGVVALGFDLDRELLLSLSGSEADITVLKGGEVVSTTYADPRTQREDRDIAAALTRGALREEVRRVVEEEGGTLRTTSSPGGERSFTVFVPILSEDGAQVVGVLAASRPAVVLAAAQRAINRTLFLITLMASAIAAVLAWVLSGRVTRPIRALTRAARQVRGGDLDVRATVDVADEVGTLGAAFNEMAQSLKTMTDDLRGAADEEANLRARMEAIMQSMGDALVATDTGGTVVAFNRAAEAMLARTAEDVVGRKFGDVLKGVDAHGGSLAEAALAGNGIGITAMVESGDGRRVPVAVTGAPLLDASGRTVGRVVVLRDTSREHEAERMKSEFLANVSHELRTPLTPIKGYTEILRRKQFPRKKAETFLDGIMESTKRLERIVEILVDFAAMEAGRLKPRLEPIDLKTFLGTVVDGWRTRAAKRRFVRKVPADLPPVLGDERLLRKCLDELLDNAVKFSPDGGDIEIEAELALVAGKRRPAGVRILIRDRGIGIEASKMGSLFQDFRQGDGSETRAFGGLGLGLSYARRIALAHRGEISATSEPGRGSVFAITLPMAPALARSLPRPAETRLGSATKKKPARRIEPKGRTRKTRPKPKSTIIRKKVAAAKIPPRRKRPR
jgi:two-component system, OmpR family, phosphate regulon sensor histidine kinase PhoR